MPSDILWILPVCFIFGLDVVGVVGLCMRSSQISRQEERHGWKVGSWREWK